MLFLQDLFLRLSQSDFVQRESAGCPAYWQTSNSQPIWKYFSIRISIFLFGYSYFDPNFNLSVSIACLFLSENWRILEIERINYYSWVVYCINSSRSSFVLFWLQRRVKGCLLDPPFVPKCLKIYSSKCFILEIPTK